jgi:translation initiation factor IF-3
MNYGKYKYELSKKQQEARKRQREKTVELKGMRLSLGIGEHDMAFKAKNVNSFLKDGDKVKLSIRLRGRERAFASKAFETMNKFFELIAENGVIEKRPMLNGYMVIMIIAPKK